MSMLQLVVASAAAEAYDGSGDGLTVAVLQSISGMRAEGLLPVTGQTVCSW
jgi:hypothetical protein